MKCGTGVGSWRGWCRRFGREAVWWSLAILLRRARRRWRNSRLWSRSVAVASLRSVTFHRRLWLGLRSRAVRSRLLRRCKRAPVAIRQFDWKLEFGRHITLGGICFVGWRAVDRLSVQAASRCCPRCGGIWVMRRHIVGPKCGRAIRSRDQYECSTIWQRWREQRKVGLEWLRPDGT